MFESMIKVLKAVSLAAGLVVAFASTSSANNFHVTEVDNPMLPPSPAMQSDNPQVAFSLTPQSRTLLLPLSLASGSLSLPFVTKNVTATSTPAPRGGRAMARPDLIVWLQAPQVAFAGQDISAATRLFARNIGPAPAPGTSGVINPAGGYMIDLVLSRDLNVPAGFAIFSPNFVEDVLLRGGRTSNTADLPPGAANVYAGQGVIPADTPAGRYFLCARIDPGNRVAESVELNNTRCARILIHGRN